MHILNGVENMLLPIQYICMSSQPDLNEQIAAITSLSINQ